jgi:hypothetical protein
MLGRWVERRESSLGWLLAWVLPWFSLVVFFWEGREVPKKADNCIQREHRSKSVLPAKPQVSAPNIGMPDIMKVKACEIERNILPQVEVLSPPQCEVTRPLPAKVDLPTVNGLRPGNRVSKAS